MFTSQIMEGSQSKAISDDAKNSDLDSIKVSIHANCHALQLYGVNFSIVGN